MFIPAGGVKNAIGAAITIIQMDKNANTEEKENVSNVYIIKMEKRCLTKKQIDGLSVDVKRSFLTQNHFAITISQITHLLDGYIKRRSLSNKNLYRKI